MTTYSVSEFKARLSDILSGLDDGGEVIVTRRGKPCARVTPTDHPDGRKPSLGSLRGALTDLPDASYEDFPEIRTVPTPAAVEDARALAALRRAAIKARLRALAVTGSVPMWRDGRVVYESDPGVLFPDGIGDEPGPPLSAGDLTPARLAAAVLDAHTALQ